MFVVPWTFGMIQLSLCWKFKQPVFISSKSPCVLHGKFRPKPASPPLPRVCGWMGQHDGFAPEAQLRHGSVENWATKNERKRVHIGGFAPPPSFSTFFLMIMGGKGSNHPNFIIFQMKKTSKLDVARIGWRSRSRCYDLKGHKLAELPGSYTDIHRFLKGTSSGSCDASQIQSKKSADFLYRRLQSPKNHVKNGVRTFTLPDFQKSLIQPSILPTLLTLSQSLSQTRPLSDSGSSGPSGPSTAASISGNPHWSIPKPAASNGSGLTGF